MGGGGWKKVDSNIAKKIVNLKRAIKYSTKIQDKKYVQGLTYKYCEGRLGFQMIEYCARSELMNLRGIVMG